MTTPMTQHCRPPGASSRQSARLSCRRREDAHCGFSRNQAVIDIGRQLTGGAVSDEPTRCCRKLKPSRILSVPDSTGQ